MILIKHPRNWGLKEKEVRAVTRGVLRDLGFRENGVELSIIFVGKVRAKKLNRQYRKMDYVPQVLGFPMSKVADSDGLIRLGDIVICTTKLKYEAKFLKKDLDMTLGEWMIHGVENLMK